MTDFERGKYDDWLNSPKVTIDTIPYNTPVEVANTQGDSMSFLRRDLGHWVILNGAKYGEEPLVRMDGASPGGRLLEIVRDGESPHFAENNYFVYSVMHEFRDASDPNASPMAKHFAREKEQTRLEDPDSPHLKDPYVYADTPEEVLQFNRSLFIDMLKKENIRRRKTSDGGTELVWRQWVERMPFGPLVSVNLLRDSGVQTILGQVRKTRND